MSILDPSMSAEDINLLVGKGCEVKGTFPFWKVVKIGLSELLVSQWTTKLLTGKVF